MTLTDQLLAQLLPPCPLCSYYRRDHEELLRDYIRMPMAAQGRAGRWWLRSGCLHSERLRPADGQLGWPTREAAESAWRTEAARLAAEHQAACAALCSSVNRVLAERRAEEAQARAGRELARQKAA